MFSLFQRGGLQTCAKTASHGRARVADGLMVLQRMEQHGVQVPVGVGEQRGMKDDVLHRTSERASEIC